MRACVLACLLAYLFDAPFFARLTTHPSPPASPHPGLTRVIREPTYFERFVGTAPVPAPDGHSLLREGGKLWSVPLQAWLVEHGF